MDGFRRASPSRFAMASDVGARDTEKVGFCCSEQQHEADASEGSKILGSLVGVRMERKVPPLPFGKLLEH